MDAPRSRMTSRCQHDTLNGENMPVATASGVGGNRAAASCRPDLLVDGRSESKLVRQELAGFNGPHCGDVGRQHNFCGGDPGAS